MKFLKHLFLIILLLQLTLSCRNRRSTFLTDDPSSIKKDTTFTDSNGQKWEVHYNAKIEEVNNSINGLVKYAFTMDNGENTYDKFGNVSKIVYKDIYRNDTYKIHINDDSLKVGEEFKASIWTKFDEYAIDIDEPKKELTTTKNNQGYEFEFQCSEAGIYKFKGTVKSDSADFPFEYKFIVN